MVIIPAAAFFSHTAVKYVTFKYSEVVAIQINETMLGSNLRHRNLTTRSHCSTEIVPGMIFGLH